MWETKLTGLDDTIAKMRALPVQLRAKGARNALGAAARLVRKAAQQNAMKVDDADTGRQIAQNIVQRFGSRYYKATGDVMIRIGVATKPGRIPKGNPDEGPKGNTPHWHLIELGREGVAPVPFLRNALSENLQTAIDTFGNRLNQQIDKLTSS